MTGSGMTGSRLVTRKLDGPPGRRLVWVAFVGISAAGLPSAILGHVYVMTAFVALASLCLWVWVYYVRWCVRAARKQGVILDWPFSNTPSDIRFGKVVAAFTITFFRRALRHLGCLGCLRRLIRSNHSHELSQWAVLGRRV
jgi:hypothetical protein